MISLISHQPINLVFFVPDDSEKVALFIQVSCFMII